MTTFLVLCVLFGLVTVGVVLYLLSKGAVTVDEAKANEAIGEAVDGAKATGRGLLARWRAWRAK